MGSSDQARTNRRLTVAEAADQLGVTVDAIRGRIRRGTIPVERDDDRVYIVLTDDQADTDRDTDRVQSDRPTDQPDQSELVRVLEEQLQAEREARRRADTIIAQLAQANAEMSRTIRALEAPETVTEEQETPTGAAPPSGSGVVPPEPEQGAERRPWWRRWFGA